TIAVDDGDSRSGCRKAVRDSSADAATRTGDHRHAPRKTEPVVMFTLHGHLVSILPGKPPSLAFLSRPPLQLRKRFVGRVLAQLPRDAHLVELAGEKNRQVLAHTRVRAARRLRVEAHARHIALHAADLAQR